MDEKDPAMVLPPLDHVGIVVPDADRAVDYYSSVFGLGPFKVNEGAAMKEVNFRGRKEDCKLKSAVAKSGAVEIEIIQVLEGECPHRDFLREGRQGLHHLAFRVENLDSMLDSLAQRGIKPLWSKDFGVLSFAYLEPDTVGGLIFELIEYRKPKKPAA